MHLGRALLLPLVVWAGCASQPQPIPPVGEFITQVIEPLAGTVATEKLEHYKAEARSRRLSPELAAFFGSIVAPGVGTLVGTGVATLHNASVDQQVAYLDTLKSPLQHELQALFTKRIKPTSDGYTVCVDGIERMYRAQDGRFLRGANGAGPCEQTLLQTLGQR